MLRLLIMHRFFACQLNFRGNMGNVRAKCNDIDVVYPPFIAYGLPANHTLSPIVKGNGKSKQQSDFVCFDVRK